MDYKTSEVLEFIEENDVKFIKLAFCDIFGNQKNITIGVFRDVTQNVKDKIIKKKMEEDTYSKKLKNEFLFINTQI